MEALYTNGPAGGGGVTFSVKPIIAVASTLLSRDAITPRLHWEIVHMKLRDIAHTRSGDKGDISNISVIAYRAEDFDLLRQAVTPQAVKGHLRGS